MKPLKLTMILLAFSFFAKANMSCVWASYKAGITIKYIASCDRSSYSNRATVDSILNILVAKLNRRDTSLKVLVLVNFSQLSFPEDSLANFFSIGFDTLREIDNDYIFDYYWGQQSIAADRSNGWNTFKSRDFPIDINCTYNRKATKEVGIKIIYDIDYRLGKPVWHDLIKAIEYALAHFENIKKEQRRDTVRYNTNGWYVSLLTIDTFAINKITGKESGAKTKVIAGEKPGSKANYWLLGLGVLGVVALMGYVGRSVLKQGKIH